MRGPYGDTSLKNVKLIYFLLAVVDEIRVFHLQQGKAVVAFICHSVCTLFSGTPFFRKKNAAQKLICLFRLMTSRVSRRPPIPPTRTSVSALLNIELTKYRTKLVNSPFSSAKLRVPRKLFPEIKKNRVTR